MIRLCATCGGLFRQQQAKYIKQHGEFSYYSPDIYNLEVRKLKNFMFLVFDPVIHAAQPEHSKSGLTSDFTKFWKNYNNFNIWVHDFGVWCCGFFETKSRQYYNTMSLYTTVKRNNIICGGEFHCQRKLSVRRYFLACTMLLEIINPALLAIVLSNLSQKFASYCCVIHVQ